MTQDVVTLSYEPSGAAAELFRRRDPEVLLSGPAGTGKSRACLEKLHLLCAHRYPGMRALMVRKTHVSLTSTTLVTYAEKVRPDLDGVKFFGGSAKEPPQYRYPNGSRVVVGGLDKPRKIMSSEYDLVYVPEATDLSVTDWESLTTRLRNGVMPYQQLIADCNPDAPTHWLKQRVDRGTTAMLESRHEDNPTLYDRARQAWTDFGTAYISKLDALTGVRFLRLRRGVWAAAEGLIYENWDRAVHLITREQIPSLAEAGRRDRWGIPLDWPRYWAVDFGYVHPFVWQAWAETPDGTLIRYAEIHMTRQLVEDHAREILEVHGAAMSDHGLQWPANVPAPLAIICDHDAEDRATLERHLGMPTVPAYKFFSPGQQAVESRLRVGPLGRPRLLFLRDALVERDPWAVDNAKPTCTEEEMESYIWDVRAPGHPLKIDDDGEDTTRYLVGYVDRLAVDPSDVDETAVYDDPVEISPF